MTDAVCRSCEASDRYAPARYCAPARCYCGHDDCPAFDSYVDLVAVPIPETATPRTNAKHAASWTEREEASWIDKL